MNIKKEILFRVRIAFIIIAIVGIAIIYSIIDLQFNQGKYWESKSKDINLSYLKIKASRGNILSDDGILIIEEPSLLECLQKISYDQFYNEHIYVFSLLSINNLIKKYRLEVFNIEKLNTHGGSLRYYIKKVSNNKFEIHKKVKMQLNRELRYGINKYSTYIKFKNKVESSKKKFSERLEKIEWNNYYNSLPFNESALALYKWSPIAEELKSLDKKIVLNSMILKWDNVKKEFKELISF